MPTLTNKERGKWIGKIEENAHPSADGTYVSGFKKLILVGTRDFHIAKYQALRNDEKTLYGNKVYLITINSFANLQESLNIFKKTPKNTPYVLGFKKLILVGSRDFHIAKYHAYRNDV